MSGLGYDDEDDGTYWNTRNSLIALKRKEPESPFNLLITSNVYMTTSIFPLRGERRKLNDKIGNNIRT